MKTGFDGVRALRYKLRMMVSVLEEPAYCYGDNMSVIYITQRPESTLKKTSNFDMISLSRGDCHGRSNDIIFVHTTDVIYNKNAPDGMKRNLSFDRILYY
jgi:hypothetical protein